MGFGKVTLLKVSPVELAQRFELVTDATAPLEGDWSAVRSKGGALFFIGALSDAAIVVPFAMFDSADELALHLREMLGDELDRHVDERGLFVLDAIVTPAAGTYEEAVGLSGSWVPRVAADDPRLNKAAGWAFTEAANAFGKGNPRVAPVDDPLAAAKERLESDLDARNDRGRLRAHLSASIEGKLEDTVIGELLERAPLADDDPRKGSAEGESLAKGMGSTPRSVGALEDVVREVVNTEIAPADVAAADLEPADEPAKKEP